MNQQCAMLKTNVLHKYDEWMVSHTNTPPAEGDSLPPPNSLQQDLSNQHFQKQFVLLLRNPHLLEVDLVHDLPVSTFVEAWPKPTP